MATSFDTQLGGRDFDQILATHFAEQFALKYGDKVDARKNPKAMVYIYYIIL